jgi:hypothetical protein
MDNIDSYRELLGSNFSIRFPDLSLELELIEVSSVVADTTEDGQKEPFSLVFRSADENYMEQGSYQLNHDTLGERIIFLVPIGTDEIGMRYEAVFT